MRMCALSICVGVCLAAAVGAADLDIRSMVVGSEILEVAENRQLTFGDDGRVESASISPNGKQVAFLTKAAGKTNLCLVKSTGGKVTTVLSSPSADAAPRTQPRETGTHWILYAHASIAWSPDSSRFALGATWHAPAQPADYILVFAANGEHETSLAKPAKRHFAGSPIFSPDSTRLAVVTRTVDQVAESPGVAMEIVVFDVLQGTGRVIYSQQHRWTRMVGWAADGNALIAVTTEPPVGENRLPRRLREIRVDGSPGRLLDPEYPGGELSPDARYRLAEDVPGVAVHDLKTGASTTVASREDCRFVGWARATGTLVYSQRESISDSHNQRTGRIKTLWLARLRESKVDTMCVALDCDGGEPSWSADGMKMAYKCRARLYVAELAKRAPTIQEKIAAGLPLTEAEEKAVLAQNAKEIGIALQLYAGDHDGLLPLPGTLTSDIQEYLNGRNLFNRPGTQQVIFTYIDPGVTMLSDIEESPDTIIGEIDPGCYSWKIVLYADTRARAVPK